MFVLFAAISAIGYHELRALVQADTWVNQSAQLQTAIHRMLQAVVDAETGVRGYLLTDNPTYLDPYHRGEAEYDAVLSQVEAGIGDHAEQRERLHRLEERVREKRAHMARTLAAFARGGFDAGTGYKAHSAKRRARHAREAAESGGEKRLRRRRMRRRRAAGTMKRRRRRKWSRLGGRAGGMGERCRNGGAWGRHAGGRWRT